MTTETPEPETTQKKPLNPAEREYDRSGFYTEEGKSFRIWALLAWLLGIVAFLAAASAILNFIMLG